MSPSRRAFLLTQAIVILTFGLPGREGAAEADKGPELRFASDASGKPMVRASGVPDAAKLSLHLIDPETGKPGPAIFNRQHTPTPGTRVLEPRFPLGPGLRYLALLTDPDQGELARTAYEIPDLRERPAPQVLALHPAAATVPANLLKFYLTFSQPMRDNRALFDHIHLENAEGERIEAPWRRQSLWSADGRRLTLWIHPGRVKRGVNLRETLGPVLIPDHRYTLVVDTGLFAANGRALSEPYRHTFSTGPELHDRPGADRWALSLPEAGSADPLGIDFGRPMDHILVPRYLKLFEGEHPAPLSIDYLPGKAARSWQLVPRNFRWKAETTYRLEAGEFLEDLAGNTPSRVFDQDLTKRLGEPVTQRKFTPKASNP